MRLLFLCLTTTLGHVPCLLLRYAPFKAITDQKTERRLFLYYLIALLFNALVFAVAYHYGAATIVLYKLILFSYCFVLSGINMLVLRGHVREHLFTCGLVMLMIVMVFSTVGYVQTFFGTANVVGQIITNALLTLGVCTALYPLLRKLMILTITPFLDIDCGDYWKTIWFVPLLMSLACFSAVPVNGYVNTPGQLLSRLMLCGAALFVCRSMAQDNMRLRREQAIAKQLSMQKEYYAALSDNVASARKTRHDLKHHLAAIDHFLEENDKAGLAEYCGELTVRMNTEVSIPYTGNAAADGILFHYARLAAQNGIAFTVSGTLKNGCIAEIDLCTLLGNALDNAIAGAKTAVNKRYVTFTINNEAAMVIFFVQNSFDGTVLESDGKLLTRQKSGLHGIGLSSMQSVCKRYKGDLTVRHEGNVFSLMAMLSKNP